MTEGIHPRVSSPTLLRAGQRGGLVDDRSDPVLEPLRITIQRFTSWLDRVGYESFDPYDLWGTRYGLYARKLYYARNPLGFALISPILGLEVFCPGLRALFVKKQRFATADAQLLLAFLNLFRVTGESRHLDRASALASDLLKISIPGYRGHCWGYPFDWQNSGALWPKNTPYITATPYCFEALLELYDASGDPSWLEAAASTARFVQDDLKDTPVGHGATAGSYSPIDNSQVINASAYRTWVLFEAAARWDMASYREKAQGNLNFVLQSQRDDGSWLYAMGGRAGAFIDHFHTCFVLKNLVKINARLKSDAVRQAIQKGWRYYRSALFDAEDLPRMFAIRPRTEIVRLEMYNFAEAITLGCLLRNEIPEALTLARNLALRLCRQHQSEDGHFVTRVYLGGIRHRFPFLRWPQAQLFYALTNLLRTESGAKAA